MTRAWLAANRKHKGIPEDASYRAIVWNGVGQGKGQKDRNRDFYNGLARRGVKLKTKLTARELELDRLSEALEMGWIMKMPKGRR